jgi:very-short-patch-repair endonuclease
MELAARQHAAVTRRQLERLGIDRRIVRTLLNAAVVTEPRPGVLVMAGAPQTWEQRVMVATLAGGGTVASHRTAARLHGLDGFGGSDVVEVSVVAPRHPKLPGVIVHEVQALARGDLTRVRGIATTGLARTLADLGSVCEPDRVLQALDDVRRRRLSAAWIRETAERLHRPGQRGTGTLLGLLNDVEVEGRGPDSWFERLVERCLASAELPSLQRQYEVRDRAGRFVGRLDAAFPSIKLGIEAHSRAFHEGHRREAADESRDLRLAAEGWEVLYVRWHHLQTPERLVDVVVRVASQRSPA